MKTKNGMSEGIDSDNEKSILRNMGIDSDMTEYLIQQRHKQEIAEKWN